MQISFFIHNFYICYLINRISWKNIAKHVEGFLKIQISKFAHIVDMNYLKEKVGNQYPESFAIKCFKEITTDVENAEQLINKQDYTDADKCKHCGSLLYDYKYFKPQVPINIKCPICGVLNKIDAIRCFNFK